MGGGDQCGLSVCSLPRGTVSAHCDEQNAGVAREGGGVQSPLDSMSTVPGKPLGASDMFEPRLRHLLQARKGEERCAASGREHAAPRTRPRMVSVWAEIAI